MRWAAQWLEKKGLGRVADTLDKRAAGVGDVRAMHAIARRALRQGEAAEAVRQLERATKLAPDDDRLWCGLGAAYRHASDFEQARQAYERALALKADNPQVLSNLGEWCMARGENEAALRWFDKALQAEPVASTPDADAPATPRPGQKSTAGVAESRLPRFVEFVLRSQSAVSPPLNPAAGAQP
jgi:tetratricopeptide (TPR) repeat protein